MSRLTFIAQCAWCFTLVLGIYGNVAAQPSPPNTLVRENDERIALEPYAPQKEGGWDVLARALKRITPNIDTPLIHTPSEWTRHFEHMLNMGEGKKALTAIRKKLARDAAHQSMTTDVQLVFLYARALAEVGQNQEAETQYMDMTARYPELPEPWNNLAALQASRGDIDAARYSLRMALRADPNSHVAKENLRDLQLDLVQVQKHLINNVD